MLDATLAQQLQTHLARLVHPVVLEASLDDSAKSAELLELLTAEQVEKYVMPIVRGEYREAWALTEPGAGSEIAALAATAATVVDRRSRSSARPATTVTSSTAFGSPASRSVTSSPRSCSRSSRWVASPRR